jgi:hypothetical protein
MKSSTLLTRYALSLLVIFQFAQMIVHAQSNDAELEQRIFNLGILRTGKSNSKTTKKRIDPKLLLAQVQEDFTKLQETDNALLESIEKSGKLEPEVIAKAITEILFRAKRLQENLTESKPSNPDIKPPEIPTDLTQLKGLLDTLDNTIVEFAHNRVFKEASAEDEQLAVKALSDLDKIVYLSTQISKSFEKIQG